MFPLKRQSKEPRDGSRAFYDATCDLVRVARWWTATPYANIGLFPGASGLVVLDIDDAPAEQVARELGVYDVETLTVQTGKGQHKYFRHPGGHISSRKIEGVLLPRGDAGFIVLPPSIHPSGARYEFIDARAPVAALPAGALAALRALGTAKPEKAAPIPLPAMPKPSELDKRIRAYLARVPNVPEGQRDDAAYRVACWLIRDMNLGRDAGLEWLRFWNVGNQPPLPERDLIKKIQSAERNGTHAHGAGLERCRPIRPLGKPAPAGRLSPLSRPDEAA